jgi:hypothetical protein
VFGWLTHVHSSPLTYLAVLGACALDAVLPIVPSEAVVIAASVLAAKGELSIWLIAWPPRRAGSSATAAPICLAAPPAPRPLDGCSTVPRPKAGSTGPVRPSGGMAPPSSWWPGCPRRQDGDDLHRRNGAAALAAVCRCRRGWRELVGNLCGRAGPAQQPRHLHLGVADPGRDVVLVEVLVEPQDDGLALQFGQLGDQAGQDEQILWILPGVQGQPSGRRLAGRCRGRRVGPGTARSGSGRPPRFRAARPRSAGGGRPAHWWSAIDREAGAVRRRPGTAAARLPCAIGTRAPPSWCRAGSV